MVNQNDDERQPLLEDSEDKNFSRVDERPEPDSQPPQERDTSENK